MISKDDYISLGLFELELKTGKQIFPLNDDNIKDSNLIKNIKYKIYKNNN